MPLNQRLESSLVYVSRALVPFGEDELRELADSASTRNLMVRVTGFLHFTAGRFTQYLEGETDSLERLFESIRNDPRHDVLGVERDTSLTSPRFPTWGMRWVRDHELREIQLETILADHLELVTSIRSQADLLPTLWGLVDSLAASGRGKSPSPRSLADG